MYGTLSLALHQIFLKSVAPVAPSSSLWRIRPANRSLTKHQTVNALHRCALVWGLDRFRTRVVFVHRMRTVSVSLIFTLDERRCDGCSCRGLSWGRTNQSARCRFQGRCVLWVIKRFVDVLKTNVGGESAAYGEELGIKDTYSRE